MKIRAEELVGRMSQLVEPAEEFHMVGAQDEPVFQNSWINYNTATHPSAGFYKHNGRVYLVGLISTGSIPSVAFTLPEGYRPNFSQDFAVASGGAFGYFYVDSNGDINIQVGNNFAFSLAGCSFRV